MRGSDMTNPYSLDMERGVQDDVLMLGIAFCGKEFRVMDARQSY